MQERGVLDQTLPGVEYVTISHTVSRAPAGRRFLLVHQRKQCSVIWRLRGQRTRTAKSEERGVSEDLIRMSREDLSRWYR